MLILDLRSGTDNDLVHISIGRLLDRERNGAGNRHWRNRHLVHLIDNSGFNLRICHGLREVRVDESRRDARYGHQWIWAGESPLRSREIPGAEVIQPRLGVPFFAGALKARIQF